MTTDRLNRDLLREVADLIEREPERFDLGSFCSTNDVDQLRRGCGTTACVAGWANLLTGARTLGEVADADRARRQLGLTYTQADRLFFWSDSVWCDLAEDLGLSVYGTELNLTILPDDLTGHLAAKGLRLIADGELEL